MNFFISQEQSGLLPVPAEERTMFVTFSKGYPVSEWEVTNFLTTNYGDCIESFYMQNEVGVPNNHPLFARVVFFSPLTIDRILDGATRAKFSINGRHVWMRKFVPQRLRISPSGRGTNRITSCLALVKSFAVGCTALVFSCLKPAANWSPLVDMVVEQTFYPIYGRNKVIMYSVN